IATSLVVPGHIYSPVKNFTTPDRVITVTIYLVISIVIYIFVSPMPFSRMMMAFRHLKTLIISAIISAVISAIISAVIFAVNIHRIGNLL
ncbi:MAG: hypothetical protein J4F41_08175, partial [Alphaproteobacteria bacterium]|nr:hypothetical protein [Alphaproteobacteria bacterium]